MRSCIILLPLCGCMFFLGCGGPSSPPAGLSVVGGTPGAPGSPPAAAGPDLSVPRLEPNPLVWRDEWEPIDETSPARKQAQPLVSRADRLKSAGEYTEAETAYQEAIAAEPNWAYPVYQLACNCELSGQHDRAVTEYMKAVTLGFDDFPTALADDELGRIRKLPNFNDTLVAIRQRYLASRGSRVGQPIALRALTAMPPGGWPLMLLLHGYGDTNLNYLDNAHDWAELGFVAVAVPGSVPASSGHYQWSMDSTEITHQDLQAIVYSPKLEGLVNQDKVYLLGFSQGALHAMLLTAEHPDQYAGAVVLSPGGSMAERLGAPNLKQAARTARIFFIHGDEEPHAPFVRIWSGVCRESGWKFASRTHSGGHHFPENWDEMLPDVAKFLTD